jgi:hypothetical protein
VRYSCGHQPDGLCDNCQANFDEYVNSEIQRRKVGSVPYKKTPKMLEVEEYLGGPLEETLANGINNTGQSQVADDLGISKATLGYWLLKFGIQMRRVALKPGEDVRIVSADGHGYCPTCGRKEE